MTLPGVTITENQNSLGVVPPDADNTIVVLGTSSSGTALAAGVGALGLYANPRGLIADYGHGPGIEAACHIMNESGRRVLFGKLAGTTAGSAGGVTLNFSGTALITISGAPIIDARDFVLQIVDAGTLGTSGITFKVSFDNGLSYGPEIALGTSYTYAPYYYGSVASGITVSFDPPSAQVTQFIAAVNEARTDFLAHMADAVAHDGADTNAGQVALAASSPAATGAEAWALMNLIRTAYELHRVNTTSVHNSSDTTNAISHAAATTVHTGIELYDEFDTDYAAHAADATVHNSADVTNTLTQANATHGTVVAEDTFNVTLTGPRPVQADITAAMQHVTETSQPFRMIFICMEMTTTIAAAVDTALDTMNTAAKRKSVLGYVRGQNDGESESAWIASLSSSWLSFSDRRQAYVAGEGLLTCAITGRQVERSGAPAVAARIMRNRRERSPGAVADGALSGFTIIDADGALVGHDEGPLGAASGLDDARFITFVRHAGRNGTYVANPHTMAELGTDIKLWQWGEVLNLAEETVYDAALDEANGDVFVDPDTGYITEEAALDIEQRVKAKLRSVLKGMASNLDEPDVFVLDRDDLVLTTETLTGELNIVPKANVKRLSITVGLKNPAIG